MCYSVEATTFGTVQYLFMSLPVITSCPNGQIKDGMGEFVSSLRSTMAANIAIWKDII
jgi:hypothetical protein